MLAAMFDAQRELFPSSPPTCAISWRDGYQVMYSPALMSAPQQAHLPANFAYMLRGEVLGRLRYLFMFLDAFPSLR